MAVAIREGFTPRQTVVTDEGFLLGDTVAELCRIYGERLRPFESDGLNFISGYAVGGPGGYLIFDTAGRSDGVVQGFHVWKRLPY